MYGMSSFLSNTTVVVMFANRTVPNAFFREKALVVIKKQYLCGQESRMD